MCYHKYYIFVTCGHSFWQPGPLVQCRDASFAADFPGFSNSCEPRSHPFKSLKVYTLCWLCTRKRDLLLAAAENRGDEIRFEEWKWRMRYQSPQAEENAWKTWGTSAAAEASSPGGASGSGGGNRTSRIRRMSGIIKAGLRKSTGSVEKTK